eukprot:m.125583 g.125583  ORF g.125583 m.125583 type:complete len:965 (+) comp12984_c0_seq1:67-2961(+)
MSGEDLKQSLLGEDESNNEFDMKDNTTISLMSGKDYEGEEEDSYTDGDDDEDDELPLKQKSSIVRSLKRLFQKHPKKAFLFLYGCFFLLFLMIFVALNQQQESDNDSRDQSEIARLTSDFQCEGNINGLDESHSLDVNTFCGCDGYNWLADFTGGDFLSRCMQEIIGALPLLFAVFFYLLLWLIAFRPWSRPSRSSKRLDSNLQFMTHMTRLICAIITSLVPDARTIADLFAFSDADRIRVPSVTSISDGMRTIAWLMIFAVVLFNYLRQTPMPTGIRQFACLYSVYRTVYFVYNIVNDSPNDDRLIFEGVTFGTTHIFTILMILPLRFKGLEPNEGRMEKAEKSKVKLRWPTLKETWQLLGTYGRRFLLIVCILVAITEGVVRVLTFRELGTSLVSCGKELATCDSVGAIYHNLTYEPNLNRLLPFFILAISVAFLRTGVRILSAYIYQKTINHMKDVLFARALDATRLHIHSKNADINQTIHYYLDREFLKTLLQKAPEAVVPIVSIVTSILLLFLLSWRLSIILTSILVFFIMFTMWRNYYTSIWQKKYLDDRDFERNLTSDVFSGFDAVQLYNMEMHERKRLGNVLRGTLKNARGLYMVDIFGDFVESQILTGAVMMGVGYGATLVGNSSTFSSTDLAQYGTVSFNAINAIKQVTEFITLVGKSKAAADKVLRLLDDHTNDANLDALPPPNPEPQLDIELKDVYFAYTRPSNPNDKPDYKMKNVSVSIPQGKSIGLVGHTGCGKSTMVKLILKEYSIAPNEGTLTLGGKGIEDICTRWLYSKVAYVPQKPTMFDENIYYNLVYGWKQVKEDGTLHDHDMQKLVTLIKAVGLHEFLEIGEETQIMYEKKASDTSGGQQQRIGIIRALLGAPKLMVLDEITSALDGSTEAAVMRLIQEHASKTNATTIIIAHRYSTIEHVDELLVVSEGAIVERGTYSELKDKQNGHFRALLNANDDDEDED